MKLNISFVVPTVDSSKTINKNISQLEKTINSNDNIKDYEIILAAQGSNDNTFEKIKNIKSKKVKKLFIKTRGKGIGLTSGMKIAKFPWILMIDDDIPYDVQDFIKKSEKLINKNEIIIGSRYVKKIKHEIPFIRKVPSFCYRTLVRILFSIPQKDIQAGIKLIKKNIFRKIHFPQEIGYVWDTELLYDANKKKLKIAEIPMFLKQNPNKLSVRSVIPKMLKDILKLWFKKRIL
jgi:glycosyltransferase involved in cell wall biosynthesis